MSAPPSRGKMLHDQLLRNLRALQRGFTAPKRVRPVLWDVTSSGTFVNDMNLDIFLARATDIVLESGRLYRWEDTVVYEFRNPGNQRLRILSAGEEPTRHAANILCNLFAVGVQTENGARQSPVPARLAGALLADEDLCQALPAINTYARRALFDEDFVLRGPGWHPDQRILIHGPCIVPACLPAVPDAPRSADRLPPAIRRPLGESCWASGADLRT